MVLFLREEDTRRLVSMQDAIELVGGEQRVQLPVGTPPLGPEQTTPHPDEIVGHPIEEGPAGIDEALFGRAEPSHVVGGLGAKG